MPEVPNGVPQQQMQFRLPLEQLAPWTLLDSAQHTLVGIANILGFIKQPELSGFMKGFAEAIAQKRDQLIRDANSRVQLAGPGELPKG